MVARSRSPGMGSSATTLQMAGASRAPAQPSRYWVETPLAGAPPTWRWFLDSHRPVTPTVSIGHRKASAGLSVGARPGRMFRSSTRRHGFCCVLWVLCQSGRSIEPVASKNGRFRLESSMGLRPESRGRHITRDVGLLTFREPDKAFRLRATVNAMFFDPRRENSTRHTVSSMP